MYGDLQIIQDFPIKVNMYGCMGTIYDLKRCGWKLAVKTEFSQHTMGTFLWLAGEHFETRAKMISRKTLISSDWIREASSYQMLESIVLDVAALAGSITIPNDQEKSFDYSSWHVWDAIGPSMVTIKKEEFDFRNIPYFSHQTRQELILPSKTINEMLKDILKEQAPRQAELREERLRERRKLTKENIIQLPNVQQRIELISIGE